MAGKDSKRRDAHAQLPEQHGPHPMMITNAVGITDARTHVERQVSDEPTTTPIPRQWTTLRLERSSLAVRSPGAHLPAPLRRAPVADRRDEAGNSR
jgi:hypothetical protein